MDFYWLRLLCVLYIVEMSRTNTAHNVHNHVDIHFISLKMLEQESAFIFIHYSFYNTNVLSYYFLFLSSIIR